MAVPKNISNVKESASPVAGLTWAEFNTLKPYLPLWSSGGNAERLKWITYLNKTRNTSDGLGPAGSKNLNADKVQEEYDKISTVADETGATDSYVARSLRKLKHINSLQAITAKTAIGVDGFFSETTDRLGSSITQTLNAIDEAASFGLDQLNIAAARIRKATAEHRARRIKEDADQDNIDSSLPGNSATKSIFKRVSSRENGKDVFNSGWATLNAKMKENRFANIPADMFNSARTLLYTIREELEQAIDAINQIFQNFQAAVVKLQRKIKAAIKALTILLMSALDWLLEQTALPSVLESVFAEIGGFLKDFGENLKDFVNTLLGAAEGESVMTNIFADLSNELTTITEKGIFTYMYEALGTNINIAIPGLDKVSNLQTKIEAPLLNSLKVLRRYSSINWLISQLPKDAQKTLGIIQALSTNAKGFIGNGIRSAFVKNVLKGKKKLFIGNAKKKGGITFTFAQPFHFGSSQYQYNPTVNPIFVLPRLSIDGSVQQVDRSGNKINYRAYTNTRLF
jgi:hypothetical protein